MNFNTLLKGAMGKSAQVIAAGGIVGVALVAAPAQAQDGDEFTGFRIEAIAGWDNEGTDYDDDVFNGGKRSDDGFMLGGGVGYDYQMGQFVIGAEGEFTESTLDREYQEQVTLPPVPSNPIARPISTVYNIEGGGDVAIAARAGYVLSPNFMLYGKVGYSWHKLAIEGTGTDNGSPFVIDEALDLAGLRLGAGGEMNFGEMFYGKIEYRYSNYNEGDFDVAGFNPSLEHLFTGVDVVRHQVVVGGGIRF
jgi:outer membrane immunogenic protein